MMRATRLRRRVVGFTLMELLVALAVSSLVALVGSALVSQGIGYFSRGEQRTTAFEQRRGVERIVRHEWRHRGASFRGDGQQVVFEASSTASPRVELGVAEVRYACERNAQGTALALVREAQSLPSSRFSPTQGPSAATPGASAPARPSLLVPEVRVTEREVLADRLRACRLAFLELKPDRQGKWVSRWVDEWPAGAPAPSLLRLDIEDVDTPRMPALVFEALRRSEGGAS